MIGIVDAEDIHYEIKALLTAICRLGCSVQRHNDYPYFEMPMSNLVH